MWTVRTKGHGLRNILGSLFRRSLLVLQAIASHVLRTGANVFEDVSKGKSWKQSSIKRFPEGLHGICTEVTVRIRFSKNAQQRNDET
jgi:hypothetical protein